MIPVGMQMYTLREVAQKDYDSALAAVKEIGYAGAQVSGMFGVSAEAMAELFRKHDLVPAAHHRQRFLIVGLPPPCLQFQPAPVGALLDRRVQVYFEVGFRQHHRANVPPDHHDSLSFSDAALLAHHLLAHTAIGRDQGDVGVHLREADFPSDVLPVCQDGVLPPVIHRGRTDVAAFYSRRPQSLLGRLTSMPKDYKASNGEQQQGGGCHQPAGQNLGSLSDSGHS